MVLCHRFHLEKFTWSWRWNILLKTFLSVSLLYKQGISMWCETHLSRSLRAGQRLEAVSRGQADSLATWAVGTRMGMARTGECFVNKAQMMPNEAKECQCAAVQSLVQRDNLCALWQARCLAEAIMLLTLSSDNGDRYHSLSEVTRDNSDKMTRHSTFTRHWLSQSWSRHFRLKRLLCPGLGPDGAGSSSGQAGLCIGNQVAAWLVAAPSGSVTSESYDD